MEGDALDCGGGLNSRQTSCSSSKTSKWQFPSSIHRTNKIRLIRKFIDSENLFFSFKFNSLKCHINCRFIYLILFLGFYYFDCHFKFLLIYSIPVACKKSNKRVFLYNHKIEWKKSCCVWINKFEELCINFLATDIEIPIWWLIAY